MCFIFSCTCSIFIGILKTGAEVLPPPDDVTSISVSSEYLTFVWNEPSINYNCSCFYYNIISENCGTCPQLTTNTSATCMNITADGKTCSFSVQTLLYQHSMGVNYRKSDPVVLLLQGNQFYNKYLAAKHYNICYEQQFAV